MKIFISAVSREFQSSRDALRSDLRAVGAEVTVQEDFQQHGGSLLEKLENYIANCDRVIALVGDIYGCEPDQQLPDLPRRSYTQWEYFFATGERLNGRKLAAKDLFVYLAAPEFSRGDEVAHQDAEAATLQRDFAAYVRSSGKDWNQFKSRDELRALVLRDGFCLEERTPQLCDRQQTASVLGTRNTVVQIHGDNNRVDLRRSHFNLIRHGQLNASDVTGLLYAEARAIPLFGRTEILNGLAAWANTPAKISIRAVIGASGSGKSRLAMELCDQLSAAGWKTGFVTAYELDRVLAQEGFATWPCDQPTLMVLDYVASMAPSLRIWLPNLAGITATGEGPLRIFLLERDADPERGWWEDVFGSGGATSYRVQALLDPREPIRLEGLPISERRNVLNAMLERLGSALRVPLAGENVQFDDLLSKVSWGGEPLYLMMAACRADEVGLDGLLALNRLELAQGVAKDERARLNRYAQGYGLPNEVLWRTAALVTLCGGLSWESLADAIPAELQMLRRPNAGDPADIVNAVRVALPGTNGAIAPIRPDTVGEAFVLAELSQCNEPQAVILRASKLSGLTVADTLIRCVQDFAHTEDQPPLTWLQFLAAKLTDPEALADLLHRLPQSTVILRRFACELANRIVEKISRDSERGIQPSFRATALCDFARSLCLTGDPGNAEAPATAAVALHRELAAQDSAVYRPELAGSLHILANCLSALGDRRRALETAQEAVDIRRNLSAVQPETFLPKLAVSLNTLAKCLDDQGDRQAALAAVQEAVAIDRALAVQNPNAFRADLAGSLCNESTYQASVGEWQGAFESAREAVSIYRELAARSPDAFRPNLAASLITFAGRLMAIGDRERPVEASREAVLICRELVSTNAAAFRPSLAAALNNLAAFLSLLGEHQGALVAAREAVAIRRDLTDKNANAHSPELAGSLNNLARYLVAQGDWHDALKTACESVEVCRELTTTNPNAFRPDLATSLNTLATSQVALGDQHAALAYLQEAIQIRRELVLEYPDVFRPNLADSLNNLASIMNGVGDHQGAIEAALEAVTTYRQLSESWPDAFIANLAGSINTLALCQSTMGDRHGALESAKEAVDIRRRLATKNPRAFNRDLAASLHTLANCLSALGDRNGALEAARDATAILRELQANGSGSFLPDLGVSLMTLAGRLQAQGNLKTALPLAREAVQIYRELATKNPGAFRAKFAGLLNNLAVFLSEEGDGRGALETAHEAVGLCQELAAVYPGTFRPQAVAALTNLALIMSRFVDNKRAAVVPAQQALDICQELSKSCDRFKPELATASHNVACIFRELGDMRAALAPARNAVAIRSELAATLPTVFRPQLAASLNNLARVLCDLGEREEALHLAGEAVAVDRDLAAQAPELFGECLRASIGNLTYITRQAYRAIN